MANKIILGLILLMVVVPNAFISYADEFESVVIKTIKITDNVYMLQGRGGNIGVIAGEDGVLMIDDQFAPLSDKIKTAISNISDRPIRFVINTHWHRDHSEGNENFARAGTIIVAHENTRKRMNTEQFVKAFNKKVLPSPKEALPVVTFSSDIKFHINGEEIEVIHIQNAHTDGNAVIYFKNSNVIHMGDTYFAGKYPFIDYSSGGGITGVVAGLQKVFAMIDDDTKIIPGHGNLSNKQELGIYLDMLRDAKSGTEKFVKEGKTLQELLDSDLLKNHEQRFGQGFLKRDKFLSIVYAGISGN
ncbi:MAG TPA: MBL fold metallo-hydrolase [Thermodesulfobacteriota bacterium]|nr:MBL fold metallo-hydrolase [Thermodesulfobacteriota bacterium]